MAFRIAGGGGRDEPPVIVRVARLHRWPAAFALVAALTATPSSAASRYDPTLIFRTLRTPHFVIYFHQGEEALAKRLAEIAETVERSLPQRLQAAPRGPTHVILVDQTDLSNGWATPLPYNTIEITAVPPGGTTSIGNTDDWLRLAFTHEYTHILHLDRSAGWFKGLRRTFGRTIYAFPNLLLPQWQVEGIATFEESVATGRGRLGTEDFAKIVDVAAREGQFEPLDRANGGLIAWPSGETAYAYGGYFHQYLVRRFGEDKLAELSNRTSGRFYYFGSGAFRDVFGERFEDLWRQFEREATVRPSTSRAEPVVQLTHHGFRVTGPRFLAPSPKTSASPEASIIYSVGTPHEFPALYQIPSSTKESLPPPSPTRLTTRFLGDHLTSTADAIYFDQLELERHVALFGDLYRLDRQTNKVTRLTCGARLGDPDVSPDGRRLAAVRTDRGSRSLLVFVTSSLESCAQPSPELELSSPDTSYESPRWSPDGTLLAAARQIVGAPSEIVVIDPASKQVTVMERSAHRNATPAWTPDGQTLLFASDRAGVFNIFAVSLQRSPGGGVETVSLSQVTALEGGATFPDVSPDGRTIAFVGYTPSGYDLFTLPLDRSRWTVAQRAAIGRMFEAGGPVSTTATDAVSASQPYSPWRTLWPRSWQPEFEATNEELWIGAATGGRDVLGRHAYGFRFMVPVRRAPGAVALDVNRPDWSVSYVYDRRRPTFYTAFSDTSTILIERDSDTENTGEYVDARDRKLELGAILPFRRVRSSHTWLAALQFASTRQASLTEVSLRDRHALRLGWVFSNAKVYGYSISPEDGTTAAVSFERVSPELGASGTANAVTADARGYLPVGSRHAVVALRGAGGLSSGDARLRRLFSLGGSGPRPPLFNFGRDAIGLLRGFSSNALIGTRAALVNLDYRMPLARIERGRGVWPLFLRTAHAAAFVDLGTIWDQRSEKRTLKRSVGGELSLDVVAGYFVPLTATAGVAWTHDPDRRRPNAAALYFRLGRAF